ncbi:MAG: alpha-L-fucosidase [Lachnospiraceae bacterium]|nr:alpha-L-fucosidase [Lachnospiraceae bacterium]
MIMANEINEKGIDAQMMEREYLLNQFKKDVANYQPPTTPELLEQIEWFRDQKFGLMVHWGLYNEVGIKESWPLVEDAFKEEPWTKWQFKPGTTNLEVKEMYAQLHKGFLPLRFDPQDWADAAYAAGFRYLIFTTKHHDGFCMWDTKTTDYKVTGSEVPWRTNKNADITKALFDAFRAKGMGISLYYSRADFDCPYYWEEGYRWKDGTARVPSYDPEEKPETWQRFKDFVFAQLKELVSDYGRIDSLWYDGGCDGVQLGLPEMTEELRKIQPWMLGVLRGDGVCEDIITPETLIPEEYVAVPWEACTVMGKKHPEYGQDYVSFGYSYDQDYMSAWEIAHLLLDVVAKGGNLALNLAPQPDGRLPYRALRELEVLAKWMEIFAPAIHGTRSIAPYRTGKYAYTRSKDSKMVHVFYLYDEGEAAPATYEMVYSGQAQSVTDMRTGRELRFEQSGDCLKVYLPEGLAGRPGDIADCFVIR